MGQAGIADSRQYVGRDGAPRSCHQGGGDGARRTVEARQNAFRDALAQSFQGETEGGEPFGALMLLDGGGAIREADGAQLAKIGLALEIEGAGRGGRRWRRESGAHPDPISGDEARLVSAQAQAGALGRTGRGKAGDAQPFQGDAAGPGQDLDGDHSAGDVGRTQAMVEHRGLDGDCSPLGGGEAEGEDTQTQSRHQGHGAPASQPAKEGGGGDAGQAEPEGRFPWQGEIKADAEPHQDRKPEHPSLPLAIEDGSQPLHRSETAEGI